MKVEIEDRNLEPTLVIYLDDGTEVGNIPGLADPEYERDAMGHMSCESCGRWETTVAEMEVRHGRRDQHYADPDKLRATRMGAR